MRFFFLSLVIIQVLIVSCRQEVKPNVQMYNKKLAYIVEDSFDVKMVDLFRRYPQFYTSDWMPNSDTLKFHDVYRLIKRVYLPKLYGLTFDLRNLSVTSSPPVSMIHIYNDSFNSILPLTDENIYEQLSIIDTLPLRNNLNFNIEMTKLLQVIKISSWEDRKAFIDIIMQLNNATSVTEFDIPKLEKLAKGILETSIYLESCKSQLMNNIDKVKRLINKRDVFIYAGAINIYICSFNNLGEVSIEVLNTTCNTKFSY